MDAQRWKRINELFLAALDHEPAQWPAFLEQECSDDHDLRREVESLLRKHETVDESFLATSPLNVKSQLPSLAENDPLVDASIGPYRIRRKLGAGGMGSVYLAVRTADFNQRVAIKVIKRGMDTDTLLKRFRTEVRVLAAVSKHPNVAALLDAGSTTDGRPFFAMEYIEGQPIDAYCRAHNLTVRERLKLFQKVCAAVQFAHQHTVVHRDLKPGNILVTPEGEPKLIDFGIAKLTAPELSAETQVPTATEFRVMTPEYASPEQARGDSITTASDVYALGVLLCELLSGRRPYDLASRSQREVERVICETEPPKPSAIVAAAAKDSRGQGATAAASRQPGERSARAMRRLLAGDLDNIVLKAIRKEPHRRYASVEQLSADIDHYLQGRPVTARAVGLPERMWRFARRNPIPVGLAAAVVISAALGIWHLTRLSQQLVRSAALESAAQQARFLEEVQDFYSEEVVPRARRANVPVTHRYLENEQSLPAPATFTIELGRHLSELNSTGSYARLYSDLPFRHRSDGGPKDEFEHQALAALREDPDRRPFYRFVDYRGRPSLRFATARVMTQSCVDCHNSHEDSPRSDWRVGDMRGVLEIIRPLDQDIERTSRGLRGTFRAMGLVFGVLILFALVAMAFQRRRTLG